MTSKIFLRLFIFSISFSTALSGCAGIGTALIDPYRIEIQQGNFVTKEMVAQLRVGMTREQVRFVLGTSMHTPLFRADRWDYVFYSQRAGGKSERRSLTVYFEDDRLVRWQGDELPSDSDTEERRGVAQRK